MVANNGHTRKRMNSMELTELDRLELSVKRTFERIERLESERASLATENSELKNRLKAQAAAANRFAEQPPQIPVSQLSEIKARLSRLIERLAEYERGLT